MWKPFLEVLADTCEVDDCYCSCCVCNSCCSECCSGSMREYVVTNLQIVLPKLTIKNGYVCAAQQQDTHYLEPDSCAEL